MSAQGVTESLHAELMFLSLPIFPQRRFSMQPRCGAKDAGFSWLGPRAAARRSSRCISFEEGYDFEGDENVFVTPDGVVPRPRGLRVKELAAPLLPHLTEILDTAPYYQGLPGLRTYNLDPRTAGASSWRIERGRADAVVLLRPNHGGSSSVRPLSSLDLVREVMQECGLPETGRAEAIGAIAKTIGNAKGFDLSLGELNGAVACLERLCRGA